MDQKVFGIILALLLAVFVSISGFLLSLTKLTVEYFLTINLLPLADGFLSAYFIGFLITTSICLALITIIITKFKFKEALVFSLIGYILGVFISIAFFIQIEFIFVLSFTVIGIVLSAKLYENIDEGFTKRFKSGTSISGKIIIFFGIGIFITIILITLPNAGTYENNFAQDIVQSFISGDGQGMSAPLISSIGRLQRENLKSVQETPEYKLMQTKNDSDFFKLDMKIEELKVFYTSDEYAQTVSEDVSNLISNDSSDGKLDLQLPFVNDLAKYAWLIYALIALASVLFIGELIIKNLSALIFAITSKSRT